MSPQNTDPQLDPSTAPTTWHLDQNIKKYVELRRSGKEIIGDQDDICMPGHMLVFFVTDKLLSLGKPGFDLDEKLETESDDIWFNILSRASTSPDRYISLLPNVGMYILCLWLIRRFIQTGNSKWNLKKVPFILYDGNEGPRFLPKAYRNDIGLEWCWVIDFLILSDIISEPELHLIPDFWKGSKDETTNHSEWRDKKSKLRKDLPQLPYIFSHEVVDNKSEMILSTAQGSDLYNQLINKMALYEKNILDFFKKYALPTWKNMRAQGDLHQDQIDKTFLDNMDWQINEWSDAFIKDAALSTTAQRMTFIFNRKDDYQETKIKKMIRDMNKLYNRRHGILAGNPNPGKRKLDPDDKARIMDLGPDLVKILEVAWPVTDDNEWKKKIKKLPLEKITGSHLNIRGIREGHRLEFLAKIVQEYLLDTTGHDYPIKSLKAPISAAL